ncbi:MAG: DUF2384 domain-containing protein [Sphingobacteriales bacterium]|nr:MAG: DUF2384 domain-containing protein [Sphingobacteriales bacterium]
MPLNVPVAIVHKLDREAQNAVRKSGIDKRFLSGTPVTYSGLLANKMLLVQLIRNGLPYSFFNMVQDYSPLSETDWADILDLSTKSLLRYKQADKAFKPIHSEKILEMAEVTMAGLDVFGTMERLKHWLDTPSFALGNLQPLVLLRDSYGKDMVLAELTRISHGILA